MVGTHRGPFRIPMLERLQGKFTIEANGCWLWTAYVMVNGYGQLGMASTPGRTGLAHRLMYEELVGPIPEGMELDHICHNDDPTCPGRSACLHRRCVNPAHLVPRTHGENVRHSPGAITKRTGRCRKGHVVPSHLPNCPTCARERAIGYKAARLAAGIPSRAMKDRTHCPKGHPYDEVNTMRYRGHRRCRACDNLRHRVERRRASLSRT